MNLLMICIHFVIIHNDSRESFNEIVWPDISLFVIGHVGCLNLGERLDLSAGWTKTAWEKRRIDVAVQGGMGLDAHEQSYFGSG